MSTSALFLIAGLALLVIAIRGILAEMNRPIPSDGKVIAISVVAGVVCLIVSLISWLVNLF